MLRDFFDKRKIYRKMEEDSLEDYTILVPDHSKSSLLFLFPRFDEKNVLYRVADEIKNYFLDKINSRKVKCYFAIAHSHIQDLPSFVSLTLEGIDLENIRHKTGEYIYRKILKEKNLHNYSYLERKRERNDAYREEIQSEKHTEESISLDEGVNIEINVSPTFFAELINDSLFTENNERKVYYFGEGVLERKIRIPVFLVEERKDKEKIYFT